MASQQARTNHTSDISNQSTYQTSLDREPDTSDRSRLHTLPPELRYMIYELVFFEIIEIQAIKGQYTEGERKLPKAEITNPPYLLLASRQIYFETHQLFYTTATFQFPAYDNTSFSCKLVKSYLQHLHADHAALISKIRLYITKEHWQYRWADQMLIGKSHRAKEILEMVGKKLRHLDVQVEINVWRDRKLEQRVARSVYPAVDFYCQRCPRLDLESVWTRHPEWEMEKEMDRVDSLLAKRRRWIQANYIRC